MKNTARLDALMTWCAVHRKLLAGCAGFALTLAVQHWGTSNLYVSIAIAVASVLGINYARNQEQPKISARRPDSLADSGREPSPQPAPVHPVPAASSLPVSTPPADSQAAGTGATGLAPSGSPAA